MGTNTPHSLLIALLLLWAEPSFLSMCNPAEPKQSTKAFMTSSKIDRIFICNRNTKSTVHSIFHTGPGSKQNKNLVLDSKTIKCINKQVGKIAFHWKMIALVTN